MHRCIACLVVALLVASLPALRAQQRQPGKPAEGTLMASGETYKLTHATAYESNFDGEADVYMIVLSSQVLRPEDIKKVRDGEKEGNTYDYPRPFMKLEFTKDGKLLSWSGGAGNTSFGRGTALAGVKSELKIGEGRLSGSASQPEEGRGRLSSAFDVRFDVALPGVTSQKPAGNPAAASTGSISGAFIGNGQEAKLAYVRARWDEPLGKPRSIRLVFTEQEPATQSDPGLLATMKKLGSCLAISILEDGSVADCEVAHLGHRGLSFKAAGEVKTSDFAVKDGQVSGEIATEGEVTTKEKKWEVKLKFAAPLDKPKRASPATTARPRPAESKPADPKPTAGAIHIKDLPLPKDAANIEYRQASELVTLTSPSDIKTLAAEWIRSLRAQRWENDGADMITPFTAVIARKRGGATVSIAITPAAKGSEVKIITTGLSWEEK
jgi:hypothetical protein